MRRGRCLYYRLENEKGEVFILENEKGEVIILQRLRRGRCLYYRDWRMRRGR